MRQPKVLFPSIVGGGNFASSESSKPGSFRRQPEKSQNATKIGSHLKDFFFINGVFKVKNIIINRQLRERKALLEETLL
jgi:hypothetical protein